MRNQELKAKFSEHYGEEYSRGIPKWRAIGMCGSEILFQQALASGDLEAVDDGGKTCYKLARGENGLQIWQASRAAAVWVGRHFSRGASTWHGVVGRVLRAAYCITSIHI